MVIFGILNTETFMLKKAVLSLLLTIPAVLSVFAQDYRYVHTVFPASVKTTGIVYGTAPFLNSLYINESATTAQNLVMDLYQPDTDTLSARPVIIFAHSGGFITGSRTVDDMQAFCDTFARKGYVTATIDYRQGLEIADNADLHYTRAAYRGLQDGRTAVRFLRANAAAYRIDPAKVYLAGSSAGSFIAINSIYTDPGEVPVYAGPVSYTAFFTAYTGPDLGPPDSGANLSFSGTPDGVLGLWGGVGDTLTIGSNNNTPLFLVHGTADATVPFNAGPPFGYTGLSDVYGSNLIAGRLAHIGIPASQTYFVPGEGHEFYGTTNGTWSNGTGGNAYWDTIVNKSTLFFWQLHKPSAAFAFSVTGPAASFTDQSQGALSWNWQFGDGTSSIAQNPSHTYTSAGNYKVDLMVKNTLQSWDTVSHMVSITSVTGISGRRSPAFRIVPNPAVEFVTIETDKGVALGEISVVNALGERMPLKAVVDGTRIVLDLDGWVRGVYFVRCGSEENGGWGKLVVE